MFSRHKHFRQSFAQHLKIIINRLSVNKYAVVIQNSFGSKHSRREDICVRFPFIFFFFCFCLLTNSPIWWILFLVVRHILCGDSVWVCGQAPNGWRWRHVDNRKKKKRFGTAVMRRFFIGNLQQNYGSSKCEGLNDPNVIMQ